MLKKTPPLLETNVGTKEDKPGMAGFQCIMYLGCACVTLSYIDRQSVWLTLSVVVKEGEK